jgi:uncharacterized protein YndB with AHSA1/START domain
MDARDGAILKTQDGLVIHFERRLNHSPEMVWNAITGPGQMSQWFDRTEFPEKLEPGAHIRFFHDKFGLESRGRIVRVEPPRLIEWMWTALFAPDQLMRWEIVPEGQGCRLIVEQRMPDESLVGRTTAGWHACLDRMEAVLDGRPPNDHMTDWVSLFERYKQALKDMGVTTPQQGAPEVKG